jgi:hypothetical protein
MAFKLTYRDGVADDYGDDTAWAVEHGVLKMGREEGDWTVLVSPSHWATIEVGDGRKDSDDDQDKDKNDKKKKDRDEDKDEDQDDDNKDRDKKDRDKKDRDKKDRDKKDDD